MSQSRPNIHIKAKIFVQTDPNDRYYMKSEISRSQRGLFSNLFPREPVIVHTITNLFSQRPSRRLYQLLTGFKLVRFFQIQSKSTR